MTILLWIYAISMVITAIFAFTNKEARGMKEGRVTPSTVLSTLLIAMIPVANTIVIIGYIYARFADWRMSKRMNRKR